MVVITGGSTLAERERESRRGDRDRRSGERERPKERDLDRVMDLPLDRDLFCEPFLGSGESDLE